MLIFILLKYVAYPGTCPHISEAVSTAFLCFSGRNSSIISDSTFYCKGENPFLPTPFCLLRLPEAQTLLILLHLLLLSLFFLFGWLFFLFFFFLILLLLFLF